MKRCSVRSGVAAGRTNSKPRRSAARLAVDDGDVLQAQVDVDAGVVVELHPHAAR